MDVEIGKAGVQESPASCLAGYVVEHITALMTLGGIESINSVKYTAGFGSRLHVSIAPFAGAPKAITDQGVIIKDAIAQIMSIANLARIVMKPSDKDLADMRGMWNKAVADANEANGASGQTFATDSNVGNVADENGDK